MPIKLPKVFKEIMESPCPNVLLYGGRLGGKTNGTAIETIMMMLQNPYYDIMVCRVSYGSLADSSYAEIEHAIGQFPEDVREQFVLKKSPLRIERVNNSGTIYFIGYGGSNTSRTKSIRTKHPILMVILEETQELKDRRNLEEALASFRRHFGKNVKQFVLYNPPPQEAHWINIYRHEKEQDTDWIVRNISYLDIVQFINDYDLKEIIKTKINDPDYYNWFYMGQSSAGFGSVYPMFRKEKHIITLQQFIYAMENSRLKICAVILGMDGAVTNDATACVPIALLNNGQSVVLDIFYHDPKQDGVIGYHQLVQDHLTRWFLELCQHYRLGTFEEKRIRNDIPLIPIFMRVDSAAPDLIQECRYFLGGRVDVNPIHKKTVFEMVGVCQSALANGNVVIVDNGGYYDYVKNKFIKKDFNILAEQISMLIWNEQQTNYDPIIPNDICDAWTYGTYFWYSNAENIQYFNILKQQSISNELICDILKGKE